MRVANVENYNNTKKIDVVKVTDVPQVKMSTPLLNEKDKTKLIKSIEMVVRSSQEYRDYIKFLKDNIDMTKCTYFNNLSNKDGKKISIEIHHEPFTLYDITMIVVDKFLAEEIPINVLDIAEEVMEIHYRDLVGLLPLSSTVHELVHEGKLLIPLQVVYGDYIKFLEDYDDYIGQDLRNILEAKLIMSKEVVDNSILVTKYVYIEVDGMSFPQPIDLKE